MIKTMVCMLCMAAVGIRNPVNEISEIKARLLSEHKSVWADFPSHFSNNTLTNSTSSDGTTNDEVAWQWGFWPFTQIT